MGYGDGVMRTITFFAAPAALGLMTGCLVYSTAADHAGTKGEIQVEGSFGGECHNGEDDDRDDLVDCRDPDCAAAGNCADRDLGGDSGVAEDSGTNEEARLGGAPLDPIERYAVPATTAGALLLLAWRRRARR